jgi:hypothetical protein
VTSDGITVKWLFRILDYEHYDVFREGQPVRQVIINHTDRSVSLVEYDERYPIGHFRGKKEYDWWRRWLREHEEPLS